uniref:Uncharacterized protein n=1 Tax=Opuntia streptacantha TaxID=393608 RepID=A0A7C9AJI3_OPUST
MAAAAAGTPESRSRIPVDGDSPTPVSLSPASSAESNFRELDDAFLQTQTRIWLGEVLQIRFDEQTNIGDILADGEILYDRFFIFMLPLYCMSKSLWLMIYDGYKIPTRFLVRIERGNLNRRENYLSIVWATDIYASSLYLYEAIYYKLVKGPLACVEYDNS